MDTQNLEQSQVSLSRLNSVVDELANVINLQKEEFKNKLQQAQNELENKNNRIAGLQIEIQNLNNALNNRKNQIEELENKNQDLTNKLAEFQSKIVELQQQSVDESAFSDLQTKLNNETTEKEKWAGKCEELEKDLLATKQTISQTTNNIDGVIARLEKVLEENGANNNNN